MPSDTLSPLPLMELATGFWSFKTLASAYELGVFEQLSGTSGTTAGELAGRLGIAERPAEMLLTGCAALGLLQSQGGRYVNSALSDEYLVPGKPNHFGGLVTMFDRRLYGGWAELTRAIRTNRPTTWDPDPDPVVAGDLDRPVRAIRHDHHLAPGNSDPDPHAPVGVRDRTAGREPSAFSLRPEDREPKRGWGRRARGGRRKPAGR